MEDKGIDPKVIESKALSLPDQAKSIVIADQPTFDRAGAKLRDVVTIRAEITAYHAPLKAAAWRAHRMICDAEENMLKPVAMAEQILKKAIGAYEHQQMEIQRQKEAEARRLAEEEAERERQKQVEEAEREAKQAMDTLLANAQTFEEAEAILENTPQVVADAVQEVNSAPPLPIEYEVEPEIRRVSGVATFVTYFAEVDSVKRLCGAIADGIAAEALVKPDLGAINRLVNTFKGKIEIPGVTVRTKTEVRARKR
jgi:vacuolar-type H+-ATPase subunit H